MTYIGIDAYVNWGVDDPYNGFRYISFGRQVTENGNIDGEVPDDESDIAMDEFGVFDENIFYYLDESERDTLLGAIADGNIKIVEFSNNDWHIDLSHGYELVGAE